MIIQQAPQQLAPVAVKTLLKLAMRQASSVAPVQETNQQTELLTATGKPRRRPIARPATAVRPTDNCTIPSSLPAGKDFLARGVKFTSRGVEIGGHAGHLSWSTLDMNNADFDTLFMTPRPPRAPAATRPLLRANASTTPGTASPPASTRPQSPPTPLTTQPAGTLREVPKPASSRDFHAATDRALRSLQKSRTPVAFGGDEASPSDLYRIPHGAAVSMAPALASPIEEDQLSAFRRGQDCPSPREPRRPRGSIWCEAAIGPGRRRMRARSAWARPPASGADCRSPDGVVGHLQGARRGPQLACGDTEGSGGGRRGRGGRPDVPRAGR
jgi:hypothetical protein